MPTHSPEPDGSSQERGLSLYPYLSLFLEADAPLWDTYPTESIPQQLQRTDWQNDFCQQTTIMKERVEQDYQKFVHRPFSFAITGQTAIEQGIINASDIFGSLTAEQLNTVSTVLFLIGYEVHDDEVVENYVPSIYDILEQGAEISEHWLAAEHIRILLRMGRMLHNKFHQTAIPDIFLNALPDVPQLPGEGDIPEVMKDFIGGLDLSGL